MRAYLCPRCYGRGVLLDPDARRAPCPDCADRDDSPAEVTAAHERA